MVELDIKTKVDVRQAEQANKQMQEGAEITKKAFDGAADKLDQMSGGAITAFKNIVQGAKQGVAAMTTLKGAIAATGIGALIIAVGSLISYFKNTQKGADQLNQAFEVVGATIDVLVDRFSTVGKAFKALFSGDLTEATNLFKDAVSGIGEEIMEESKAALELEKRYQALEKQRVQFIVQERKLQAEIEKARLESEQAATAAERLEANQRAIKLTRQLAKERTAQAKEAFEIQKARNGLGETLLEDLEKEKQLEAELFSIQQDQDSRLQELVSRQKSLSDEAVRELEAKRDIKEIEQLEKIEPRGAIDIDADPVVMGEAKRAEKIYKINEDLQDSIDKMMQRHEKERITREEKIADAKIAIEQQAFRIATQLAGENAEAQKGIAIAQAIIDTYRGANLAIATIPPPFGQILAGTTIATGLLNVRQILNTDTSGGATSAPSMSAPRPSVGFGEETTRDPNIPNFDFGNQGVGGGQDAGLNRNYVILQEIKDAEAVDQIIQDKENSV